MRLKGRMAGRLSPEKKARMEATLERMTKTRRKDDMYLRDVVKEKLEWAKAEKQKGFDTIKALKERIQQTEAQIENVDKQIWKLEGIILVLNELTSVKSDEEKKAKAEAVEKEDKKADEKEVKEVAKKKKVVKKTTGKSTRKYVKKNK